jgi:hypothetical protein
LKKIILVLSFLFFTQHNFAQKITGTWEGDLGGDEFLQVNLIEVGKNLCGYTFDQTYRNKGDYCKAYCNGTFNNASSTIFLNGYSFMENSGGHVLMQLKLKVYREAGVLYLRGFCRTSGSMFFDAGEPMAVSLKKTSNKPAMYTQTMKDCVKEYKDENIINNTVPEKKAPAKPLEKKKPELKPKPTAKPIIKPKPTIVTPKKVVVPPVIKQQPKTPVKPIIKPKPIIVVPKKTIDTVKKVLNPPIAKQQPKVVASPLPKIINGRSNKEMSRIIVNDRKLKLEIYDNGDIDGDSVSIYYNNKKIVFNKKLSLVPIVINLDLDENTNIHSIVMFAENLGSIPPNTALIIVTTPAGKRYELYSSANLNQNAELIFEYKPK